MSTDVVRSDRLFGIIPQSWVTPLTVCVFAVIATSGLMLFLGLFEGTVKEMHEWLGVAFVAVAALHLAKNWRPFTLMLGKPALKFSAIAVALVAAVFIGGAVMEGGEQNPMRAVAQAVEDAPIETVASLFNVAPQEIFARLQKAGIEAAPEARSLAEIAQKSGAEPREVLAAVTGVSED